MMGDVDTIIIPCEKCHRAVIHRFVLRAGHDDASGAATLEVVQRRDPHICPRPTSTPIARESHVTVVGRFLAA